MALLLDTHALIWWVTGNTRMPENVRGAIAAVDETVLVSAASAWEIATKHRLGKLPEAEALMPDMAGILAGQGFSALPISIDHAERAGRLPGPHRDPFDRMLIAQALSDNLQLVSNEAAFDAYGVARLW